MSATEEVRRLLDERGIEWRETSAEVAPYDATRWVAGGITWEYLDCDGIAEKVLMTTRTTISPKRAVEVSLGRETCRDEWADDSFAAFKCSKCGGVLVYHDKKRISCCPFCERRVAR